MKTEMKVLLYIKHSICGQLEIADKVLIYGFNLLK